MQDVHTSANLAESPHSLLPSWDMGKGELVCYTTDNGTYVEAAERKLECPWLSCFGCNFHLSITGGVASESRAAHVMDKCKSLADMLLRSWCEKENV